MIRVLIVEGQAMMRDALKIGLSHMAGIDVVGAVGDPWGAFSWGHIDLVLMDLCHERSFDGLEAAAQIKARGPSLKVVLMASVADSALAAKAKAAGVDSFISKDMGLEQLAQVIEDTYAGKGIYSQVSSPRALAPTGLTQREAEILELICDGLNRREVAERLCIAQNSVKTHFANILSKTGYRSIAKLALFAVSRGYVYPHL